MILLSDLKTYMRVILHEFPENDVPEQKATILDVFDNGMLTVEVDEPEEPGDDCLRDVHYEFVKEIIA